METQNVTPSLSRTTYLNMYSGDEVSFTLRRNVRNPNAYYMALTTDTCTLCLGLSREDVASLGEWLTRVVFEDSGTLTRKGI